jgi:hypothetical protein
MIGLMSIAVTLAMAISSTVSAKLAGGQTEKCNRDKSGTTGSLNAEHGSQGPIITSLAQRRSFEAEGTGLE